jgi:hypothetical protein
MARGARGGVGLLPRAAARRGRAQAGTSAAPARPHCSDSAAQEDHARRLGPCGCRGTPPCARCSAGPRPPLAPRTRYCRIGSAWDVPRFCAVPAALTCEPQPRGGGEGEAGSLEPTALAPQRAASRCRPSGAWRGAPTAASVAAPSAGVAGVGAVGVGAAGAAGAAAAAAAGGAAGAAGDAGAGAAGAGAAAGGAGAGAAGGSVAAACCSGSASGRCGAVA